MMDPEHILQSGKTVEFPPSPHELHWFFDGSSYFSALRLAITKAKSTVFMMGWEFSSQTLLDPVHHPEETLLDLLNERDHLKIYILAWQFPGIVYGRERELFQKAKISFGTKNHVYFAYDGLHPIGGSHHEKIVVVDNQLAFCGGLDITTSRWDTHDHAAANQHRRVNNETYGPFHDLQASFVGEAAKWCAHEFGRRWRRCSTVPIDVEAKDTKWPNFPTADFSLPETQLTLTTSSFDPQTSESHSKGHRLHLDLIAAASSYIYIENQYLTDHNIAGAIAARLKDENGPCVIIILPRRAGGVFEKEVMGRSQDQIIRNLQKQDLHDRLRIVYVQHQDYRDEQYLKIHSKLMICDHRILRLGSSNLNHRSAGMDTECDIVVSFAEKEESQCRQILAACLAHLLQQDRAKIEEELSRDSLREVVDRASHPNQRIPYFVPLEGNDAESQSTLAAVADPARPFSPDGLINAWITVYFRMKSTLARMISLPLLGWAIIGLLALVWGYDQSYLEPVTVAIQQALDVHPEAALVLFFALFLLVGTSFFPQNMVLFLTFSVWDFQQAAIVSLFGITAGQHLGYAIGRLTRNRWNSRFKSARYQKVLSRIQTTSLAGHIGIRWIPVAPHALINLASGFAGIPYPSFACASLLGSAPTIAAVGGFQYTLEQTLLHRGTASGIALAGFCLLGIALYRFAQQRLRVLDL